MENKCDTCRYKQTIRGETNKDFCEKIGQKLQFKITECSMYVRNFRLRYKNEYPGNSTHDDMAI